MAKTIKVQAISYNVTADVIINTNDGIKVVGFDCGGFLSRNVRALKQGISAHMHDDIIGNYGDDAVIIAIENIKTEKIVYVKSYKINASNMDIINACVNAGIDVVDLDMVKSFDDDNEDDSDSEQI